MAGINKVILVGNVGRIEAKQISNGVVVNMSLATSTKHKDKSTQQWVEQTEWHNIVIFGDLAVNCEKYVHKGSKLYLEGALKTEKYEKDGSTRYTTKIIAREVQFLDSKQDGASQPAQAQQQQNNNVKTWDLDDAIPF